MTEDIINQSEPEKQDKNQIAEKNLLKLVRFWSKNFTTRQILIWIFYNASDIGLKEKYNALYFEKNFFSTCQILKNVCIQKITFWSFLLRENDIFCIFRSFFKKLDFELKFSVRDRFWIQKNPTRQILVLKKYNASDFELKKIQRVRFWVKNNTTYQIMSVLLLQFAKFLFIHQSRDCFGNVLMYGLGSICQVILLG